MNRPRYHLVVFDFDGTLADSLHVFVAAVNALAPRHGFQPLDATRLDALRGLNAREMMAGARLPAWRLAAVARAMRREMRARADAVRPFPGVRSLLSSLATRHVAVALVTSNAQETVERVLGEDVIARFATMSCGASLLGKAPRLRAVLRSVGVAPGETLCVGDELRDADAAQSVGADFLAVAWGYTHPGALAPRSIAPPCQTMDAIASIVLESAPAGPRP